jgi:hypothetical protein
VHDASWIRPILSCGRVYCNASVGAQCGPSSIAPDDDVMLRCFCTLGCNHVQRRFLVPGYAHVVWRGNACRRIHEPGTWSSRNQVILEFSLCHLSTSRSLSSLPKPMRIASARIILMRVSKQYVLLERIANPIELPFSQPLMQEYA